MSAQLIIVLVLNAVIAIIGTLAYSVRLVGVKTGKLAMSFSLFDVIMLFSRVAVTFQIPLLTKYVEENMESEKLLRIFMLVIVVSGMATIIGAFLIPTFQKLFYKGVQAFSVQRSIPKLALIIFSKNGLKHVKTLFSAPSLKSISKLDLRKLPKRTILLNMFTVALVTSGAFAPIYAGSLEPDLRATCITLSSIINGMATIMMSVFIDPTLSIMTDDVIEGKCSEQDFRTCVIGMVGSKTAGTFLALPMFLPAAYTIVFIARLI